MNRMGNAIRSAIYADAERARHNTELMSVAMRSFQHRVPRSSADPREAYAWVIEHMGKPFLEKGADGYYNVRNRHARWELFYGEYYFASERDAFEFKMTWL